MALTPQNEDAFFREVDDELRRDQMVGFWRRYGMTVAVGVVLLLIALGGAMVWQRTRAQAIGHDSETLTAGLDALSKRDPKGAEAKLKPLGGGGNKTYAALAKLTLASAAAARAEPGAAAGFTQVADDAAMPEPLRQAALVRRVTLEFDRMKPADIVAELKPLAVEGSPWFGTAGELTAAALVELGRPAEAGRLLARLARATPEEVPETIRGRALRMAAALGIDATPVAPTTQVTLKE